MNVGAGGDTWYRTSKSEKRNSLATQIIDESLALDSIRVKRDVHSISMVVAELIMRRTLANGADG